MSETEVIPATDIDYALYASEFRRLGMNLNERLKRMNTTGEIDCDEIDNILLEIKKTADLWQIPGSASTRTKCTNIVRWRTISCSYSYSCLPAVGFG
jgi:hypothetical protein